MKILNLTTETTKSKTDKKQIRDMDVHMDMGGNEQ